MSLYPYVFILLSILFFRFTQPGKTHLFLLFISLLAIAYIGPISLASVLISISYHYFIYIKLLQNKKSNWFHICLGVDLILLFTHNYWLFQTQQASFFDAKNIFIAAGFSFYTIQQLVFLWNIRKTQQLPYFPFLDYALVNVWFPKFVCGPILQASEWTPILHRTAPNYRKAGRYLLLAVFKKMVIADHLNLYVQSIFDHPNSYPAMVYWAGGFLFTVQLYFDFSAYCEAGMGISLCFGILLPENFNQPLLASSIRDFWRKWHISLIKVFTTCVYYPVQYYFRQHKTIGLLLATACTFLISGAWHGLGLGFFIWSLLHLMFTAWEMTIGKSFQPLYTKIPNFLRISIVIAAVSFAHLFFRAPNSAFIQHFFHQLQHHFFPTDWNREYWAPLASGGHQEDYFNFTITIGLALLFIVFEQHLKNKAKLPLLIGLVFLILIWGYWGNTQRFIYMQF